MEARPLEISWVIAGNCLFFVIVLFFGEIKKQICGGLSHFAYWSMGQGILLSLSLIIMVAERDF